MLQEVVSIASQRSLSGVAASFENGPRNQPVRDFFDASGLQTLDSAYVGKSLNFEAPDTVSWTFSDGRDSHSAAADVA